MCAKRKTSSALRYTLRAHLHRLAEREVDDVANIRLVHAHAKGDGGHHHLRLQSRQPISGVLMGQGSVHVLAMRTGQLLLFTIEASQPSDPRTFTAPVRQSFCTCRQGG